MTGNFFGGAPSLTWSRKTPDGGWVDRPELLGKIRGGLVVDIGGPQQATDITTGKPAWWEPPTATTPGRPKMQYVVTLRCDGSRGGAMDERDPSIPNDLGDRRLFIPDGDMRKAVGDAMRGNARRDLEVGDELYVAWTGKRPSKIGGNPAKTWASKHVAGPGPGAQHWTEEAPGGAAAAPAAPGGYANPFAPQGPAQPAQGAGAAPPPGQYQQPVYQPQGGQVEVPAQQVPQQPAANPFGGPIPAAQPPTQTAPVNPFAPQG